MTDKNKLKHGLLQSAKVRIVLFAAGIVAFVAVAAMIWHHHSVTAVYAGAASVASAPSDLHNTPGAADPSDNYVQAQDQQNAALSREAKQNQTSSVPTITRANFLDDASGFQSDVASPAACPLSKVVYMYRPNPANCSVPNLILARESGVSAQELRCQSCGCPALRAAGYTVGDLKDTGLDADHLKRCGFDLKQLIAAGFSAQDLKKAGFSADQLRAAGFSAGQLASAGFSAQDLRAAGFSAQDLKKAGFSADQLRAAGFTSQQLADAGVVGQMPWAPGTGACSVAALQKARDQGVSPVQLKNSGCSLMAMRAAGFTPTELKAAGFSAADLKKAGFSAQDLRKAGFSAADLKAAGFTPADLKKAGYSAADLKNAGFSAADLKAAGFSVADLKKAGYSAADLKNAGFSAGALRAAGFSAADLKQAGFSARQLRAAGFGAKELKEAGFTASQLKKAGFTGGDLVRAGFSATDAGYAPVAQASASPASSSKTTTTTASSMPSIEGGFQTAQLRELQEAQQRMMSEQQRQDAMQQAQGQMMVQATKLMAGWSSAPAQTQQRALEPPVTHASGGASSTAPSGPTIKAGTILFGVLDTSINSDETNTPVMATVVSGDLQGAKLLGQFTRVDKRLLLNFTVVNVPSFHKSFTANIVAIDPNTAHTAMAGYVNNHYLLRYGSLLAAGFLSGVSQGIQNSGSTVSCFGPFCTKVYGNLKPLDYVGMGLGQVGQQYSNSMSSNFNTPPTVKVPGGIGIGLLFMADSVLPEPLPPKPDTATTADSTDVGGE